MTTSDGHYAPAPQWRTGLGNGQPDGKVVAGIPLDELTRSHTYTEVVWLVTRHELPTPAALATFDACLTAIVDHGFRNSVATAARFAASAADAPIPAIVSGISAIGRHTAGAQSYVAEWLVELTERVAGGEALDDVADAIVARHRDAGTAVPGFGTKLHSALGHDPRSTTLLDVAAMHGYRDTPGVTGLHTVGEALARTIGRHLVVNIDGAMGAVLHDLGFNPVEVAALEVVVMLPSILGHTLEELREHHPMRLLPDDLVEYIGPPRR